MEFFGVLVLILVLTMLAGHFATRVGIPAVVGELLVGIIIGPGVLSIVKSSDIISTFSEIGVIILMFLAGLESDLGLLKKYARPALIVAGIGVVFPVVIVGGVWRESDGSSLYWRDFLSDFS